MTLLLVFPSKKHIVMSFYHFIIEYKNIFLDGLVCSIKGYFYESRSSPFSPDIFLYFLNKIVLKRPHNQRESMKNNQESE